MRLFKLICLTLTALVVLPLTAAHADTWRTNDPKDNGGGIGDVSRIRVDNAPRNLFLRVKYYEGAAEGNVNIFIDTRRSNPGPEFRIMASVDPEVSDWLGFVELYRVDNWKTRRLAHARRCDGMTARADEDVNLSFKVPRRCLKINGRLPGAVRMSLRSGSVYGGPGGESPTFDWAPRWRGFGRWVAHK